MAYLQSPMDFYKGMNASAQRAREGSERMGQMDFDFKQRMRDSQLQDNELMRQLMLAKIEKFKEPTPDFYGGDMLAYNAPASGGVPEQPPAWFLGANKKRRMSGSASGPNVLAALMGGA